MSEYTEPLKENMPQEETGQKVQEVQKDNMWAIVSALSPEQQKDYLEQIEEAAKRLIVGFKPMHQGLQDYDRMQKQLQTMKDSAADAAQPPEAQKAQAQLVGVAAELSEAARQQAQIVTDITNGLAESVRNMFVGFSQSELLQFLDASIGEAVREIRLQLTEATKKIRAFCASDSYQTLQETLQGFSKWYNNLVLKDVFEVSTDEIITLSNLADEFQKLLPYIQEEAEAYKKETGADCLTVEEFFRDTDPDTGEAIESVYSRVLQRAKEKALPKLESISKLPGKYVMPNNPIVNSLAGRTDKKTGKLLPTVNAGGFDLPVLNSGKKNEVTAYTMISLEDTDNSLTMTGRPFTEYDRCVLNSVVSLWEAGNEIFTPEMVCRTMSNKTRTEYISPQAVEAATKSIEKMRRIFIKANLTEEAKKRGFTFDGEPVDKCIIGDFLLSLKDVYVAAGGKEKFAYRVNSEPDLLKYSRETRQIITVNSELLDVKKVKKGKVTTESILSTVARQPIKEYLLRRIAIMKHDQKSKRPQQDQHILLDTLYRETGANKDDKTELKRTRDYSFQVLDFWTAAGYISGYEIIKQGRKLYSILIKL